MRRKDLKMYSNWYNGKQRLFIGRFHSFIYLRDERRFGLNTSNSLLWFDRWSFKEHKEHCLGVKRMRNFMPLPKESVLLPTIVEEDLPF